MRRAKHEQSSQYDLSGRHGRSIDNINWPDHQVGPDCLGASERPWYQASLSKGSGTTTVTHAAASEAEVSAPGLTIAWRFPRENVAPVRLDWEGEGELVLGRDPGAGVQVDGHDVSRRH